MSIRAGISLAIIALIVGVIAGGWSIAAAYKHHISQLVTDFNHHTSQLALQRWTSDANIKVHDLRLLRAGKITNATESLELNLECDLIELERFVAAPSEFNSDSSYIEALREVRDYRTRFPYKTNPDVERSVAEVFTLLDVHTNR